MTWSITKSKVVGGDAIVKWNDKPLRQLSDDDFTKAANAASALGECVCLDATEVRPGLAEQAARADLIVRAVMTEMERRDTGTPAPKADFSDTGEKPAIPMEGTTS